MKPCIVVLGSALGILGAGVVVTCALQAHAETLKPRHGVLVPMGNQCASVAPNKQLILANGAERAAASVQGGYGTTNCPAFVVDVAVTAASKPPLKHESAIQFTTDPTVGTFPGVDVQATCESIAVTLAFFRKKAGEAKFSKLGGGSLKGKWTPNSEFPGVQCAVVAEPGYQAPAASYSLPTGTGTDVYRIAISHKIGKTLAHVTAGLQHPVVLQ